MHTPSRFALPIAGALLIMVTSSACDSPYFDRNNPARIHRNNGIAAFKKERWAEAADEWALSLAANPNQKELYEKQAFAASKAGRLDDAAQTLLKTAAFKTDPKEKLDVTRKIAAMYLQYGKLDKAEQYFKEILKEVPSDDATMTWLGEIHSALGGARSASLPADLSHLEEAISYYDKALAINPEGLTPTVNKRIALFKMRDYWQLKKNAADKEEAALPKRDKKGKAEVHARGVEMQAKLDELAPRVEEASTKVTELLAKRKAAADAADGGSGGGDGGTSDSDAGTPGSGDAGK